MKARRTCFISVLTVQKCDNIIFEKHALRLAIPTSSHLRKVYLVCIACSGNLVFLCQSVFVYILQLYYSSIRSKAGIDVRIHFSNFPNSEHYSFNFFYFFFFHLKKYKLKTSSVADTWHGTILVNVELNEQPRGNISAGNYKNLK